MTLPRYRRLYFLGPLMGLCTLLPLWLALCAELLRSVVSIWPSAYAPLPAYQLSLQGRSDVTHARLHVDGMLRIELRPQVRVSGPVMLRAFLGPPLNGSPWPVSFEAREGGGFVLQAPIRELPGLRAGRIDLLLRIERPLPWLPLRTSTRACPEDASARQWCQSVTVHLELPQP